MAALRHLLVFAILWPILCGATWSDTTTPLEGEEWTDYPLEWQADQKSPYGTEPEAPPEGWYTDPADFEIPGDWPDYVKRAFEDMRLEVLPARYLDDLKTWAKEKLALNTHWIDAQADRNSGYIWVNLPAYRYFTVVRTDPNNGIVEQDFKGHAKIYGLDDDAHYRIYAWDASGCLGTAVTALSDKYARALPDGYDLWGGGRCPAMSQSVLEDKNRNLWITSYQVNFDTSYRFVDLYSIDANGKIRSRHEIPHRTSYIRTWETDLLLEDNGDAVVCACESPEGYAEYLGPSYLARVDSRTGATVWQADNNEMESALGVIKTSDAVETDPGYIYCGATFNPAQAGYSIWGGGGSGEQWGSLVRMGTSGNTLSWESSGTSLINTGFVNRDIVQGNEPETFYYDGGCGTSPELTATAGGACSTTFSGGNCGNAFDNDEGTAVFTNGTVVDLPNDTLTWDFGAGNAQEVRCIDIKYLVENPCAIWLYIEYSDDAVAWTLHWQVKLAYFANCSGWWTTTHDHGAHRYWRIRTMVAAGEWNADVYIYEFRMYGYSLESAIDDYFYTCGQRNIYGQRLDTTEDGSGTCGGGAVCAFGSWAGECDYLYDGSLDSYRQALDVREGFARIDFDAPNLLTFSRFYYSNALCDPPKDLKAHLQYWDGAAWQTYASHNVSEVAGVHYWEIEPAGRTEKTWRVYLHSDTNQCFDIRVLEWITHYKRNKYATIAKFHEASGVTEGTTAWTSEFAGSAAKPGIFYSLMKAIRKPKNRIYAVGSTDQDREDLNLNTAVMGCVNESGTTLWYREYPVASEFYDIAPTKDGHFLLAGTLYSGTSVEQRSMVILKVDKNGDYDADKWPMVFAEEGKWADGRAIIETRDKGILAVGGSSEPVVTRSKPYMVKLDRFYRSRSHGDLYD